MTHFPRFATWFGHFSLFSCSMFSFDSFPVWIFFLYFPSCLGDLYFFVLWTVALNDLRGLFHTLWFYNSILHISSDINSHNPSHSPGSLLMWTEQRSVLGWGQKGPSAGSIKMPMNQMWALYPWPSTLLAPLSLKEIPMWTAGIVSWMSRLWQRSQDNVHHGMDTNPAGGAVPGQHGNQHLSAACFQQQELILDPLI